MGVGRNIFLTDEGKRHSMFKNKPWGFSAFESHEDEVTKLPKGALLLASNRHSPVQAAEVTYGNGKFWACQYHPEYDLHEIGSLIAAREERLTKQGFFSSKEEVKNMVEQYRSLNENQEKKDLKWQLGIDDDLINQRTRQHEFNNWLQTI